jgi:hypothetical protein
MLYRSNKAKPSRATRKVQQMAFAKAHDSRVAAHARSIARLVWSTVYRAQLRSAKKRGSKTFVGKDFGWRRGGAIR